MRTMIAALAAAILAGTLHAQPGVAKPEAEPAPTAQELTAARNMLSLFVSALNSNEVPEATKSGLLRCLNNNPLGAIAAESAKIFAENKSANANSPGQRLFVVASLCHAPLPGLKAGH